MPPTFFLHIKIRILDSNIIRDAKIAKKKKAPLKFFPSITEDRKVK